MFPPPQPAPLTVRARRGTIASGRARTGTAQWGRRPEVRPGSGGRTCAPLATAYSGRPCAWRTFSSSRRTPLVMQSKQALADGRDDRQQRRLRRRLVRRRALPGVYRSTEPAWNDRNLRELSRWPGHGGCSRTSGRRPGPRCSSPTATRSGTTSGSGCTTAHLRLPDDQTGDSRWRSTPTSSRSWRVDGLGDAVLPRADLRVAGRPAAAVASAVGLVEDTAVRHGIDEPVQMTVATTDGTTTWAFRYSSAHASRSLFHSTDVSTLKHQYP